MIAPTGQTLLPPAARLSLLPVTGVLLANIGTPDDPSPRAVRRYLAEFLWDPRVIDLPRWKWWLIA